MEIHAEMMCRVEESIDVLAPQRTYDSLKRRTQRVYQALLDRLDEFATELPSDESLAELIVLIARSRQTPPRAPGDSAS